MSEDLKHDAHIVKVFTARSLSVLRKNKVDIHKIIEFTDQAPLSTRTKHLLIIWPVVTFLHRKTTSVLGMVKVLVMLVLGG